MQVTQADAGARGGEEGLSPATEQDLTSSHALRPSVG